MKIPKDFALSFSPQIQPITDFKKNDWFLPIKGVDQKYAARELPTVYGTLKRIVVVAVVVLITVFVIAGLVAMHK